LRDASGKILKWYGTNTDIHDLVMARIDAARNKLQVLTVLAHAEVNLFAIDNNRICTMAEGGMLWDNEAQSYDVQNKSSLYVLEGHIFLSRPVSHISHRESFVSTDCFEQLLTLPLR